MANSETKLKIVVDAEDNASRVLGSMSGTLDRMKPTFTKMAVVGSAAFAGITAAIASTVSEARAAEAAQFRLSHILKTATGATDEQIAALTDQANALERVGVVSGEAITQAQAQLATFDLQADTIKMLTPAILDYVVAEKGAAASTDDLKQLTNGLAQALNGNFGSLTRVGFVLDDVTRELISNGTEAERAAAIVSVLNSTYEGFNEAARGTAEGGMQALNNEFGRLKETIGAQFLPILNDLTERMIPVLEKVTLWIEQNPELTRNIIITVAALAGFVAVMGTLSLILLAFNPIAIMIMGVIAGVGLIVYSLTKTLSTFGLTWSNVWNGVKDVVQIAMNAAIGAISPFIDKIEGAIKAVKRLIDLVADSGLGKMVKGLFDGARASGGPVSGGKSYLVGEQGPELFSPASSGTIIPNRRLASMTSAPALYITGNTFLSEDAAERMGDLIMSRLKLSNAL